jgi:glycerol-3-phosphate dehydrogenase
MNLAIALTAAEMGATTVNHCSVVSLIKTEEGTVSGARVHDHMSGLEYDVKAKCVINATGPFVDNVRLMDNPSAKKLIQGSAGVHVVLPAYYSPRTMGLLDPETSDGRVIFFLPWEGKTLAGTTDEATEVTHSPSPSEAAVQFILNEVQNYLGPEIKVRRGDVLSAFSGIRPLVVNPDATDTQSVVRDHFVEVSDSGMVTITGGKWTTYRIMAADTVDAALRAHPELKAKAKRSSSTLGLMLTGGRSWNPMMHIQLSQDYGVDEDVALHLSHTYGDKAGEICAMAHMTGRRWPVVGRRLLEEFPVIEAEIKYATRKEYACTVVDVIARRTRLAFLNVEAAREVVPRIIQIMAKQLKWDEARCKKELADAEAFLLTMGRAAQLFAREKVPYKEVLSIQDIGEFTREFRAIAGPADVIRADELQRLLKMTGSEISTHQIRQLFDEVDTDESGSIELDEFLTLMANIKRGTVANSRLAHVVQMRNNDHSHRIPVDRSGGGV